MDHLIDSHVGLAASMMFENNAMFEVHLAESVKPDWNNFFAASRHHLASACMSISFNMFFGI